MDSDELTTEIHRFFRTMKNKSKDKEQLCEPGKATRTTVAELADSSWLYQNRTSATLETAQQASNKFYAPLWTDHTSATEYIKLKDRLSIDTTGISITDNTELTDSGAFKLFNELVDDFNKDDLANSVSKFFRKDGLVIQVKVSKDTNDDTI